MGQTSAPTARNESRESLAPDIIPGQGVDAKSAFYWIGVKREHGSPPQTGFSIGGVTFTTTHTPIVSSDGKTRAEHMGYVRRLTTDQVRALKAGLRKSVIRWHRREGTLPYGQLVKVPTADDIKNAEDMYALTPQQKAAWVAKCRGFMYREGDEPAGKFVYCVRLDDPKAAEGTTWRPSTTEPASVLETGIQEPR